MLKHRQEDNSMEKTGISHLGHDFSQSFKVLCFKGTVSAANKQNKTHL